MVNAEALIYFLLLIVIRVSSGEASDAAYIMYIKLKLNKLNEVVEVVLISLIKSEPESLYKLLSDLFILTIKYTIDYINNFKILYT